MPSLYSSVRAGPTVTGPPNDSAATAPMGCAFGCPVPPARSSVPVSTSASCRLVAPRRAAPSLPSGGRSLVGRAVGGFWSPPLRPHPSYLRQDWDAVEAPRVLTPLGPLSSLGVESSHDYSTPPPFVCGVESSCHDSTPPPPPLRVQSSWDNSVAGRVIQRRFDHPPHSVAAPPGVFFHSGDLAAPLLPFHSVGIGVHFGGLAAPRVSLHSPGFFPFPSPAASFFPKLLSPRPIAAPRLPPVGRRGGAFPAVAHAVPRISPLPSLPAFLHDPW